jgi:hypothetical protein
MRTAFRVVATALAVACLGAACTERDAAQATATPRVEAATGVAAPATAVAPAGNATRPGAAPSRAAGPLPTRGAITFLGFGPAPWGASLEQLMQAWGGELEASPGEPGGCRYLFPLPRSEAGYSVAFMIEGGRFVRTDVRAPEIVAPGGGHVGMARAELRKRYPAAVELPHKYVEGGLDVRAVDPAGGHGVAVFEVDADGKVTAWRVGVPPQVDYVEGCS